MTIAARISSSTRSSPPPSPSSQFPLRRRSPRRSQTNSTRSPTTSRSAPVQVRLLLLFYLLPVRSSFFLGPTVGVLFLLLPRKRLSTPPNPANTGHFPHKEFHHDHHSARSYVHHCGVLGTGSPPRRLHQRQLNRKPARYPASFLGAPTQYPVQRALDSSFETLNRSVPD